MTGQWRNLLRFSQKTIGGPHRFKQDTQRLGTVEIIIHGFDKTGNKLVNLFLQFQTDLRQILDYGNFI